MAAVCVLMVASGAAWESAALGMLSARPGIVVLRRCVDVEDLLAVAATGQADVAVLDITAHGFDAPAMERLGRHRVRPVAVTADPASDVDRARAARLGVTTLVAADDLDGLAQAVLEGDRAPGAGPVEPLVDPDDPDGIEVEEPVLREGPVVVVWGPTGAPGRTTVALALGAELARRGGPTLVVDADPYGGAVAQQLGVMDEVSGLLAAARLSATGDLEARFGTVQRSVADRLRVLTGLPRPDRWREVRADCVEHVLELGRAAGHVVVDTGFCLEDEPTDLGSLPGRNAMTLAALAVADEILVVGSADPVGLSRLARALVDVREVTGGVPVRVVVNRMRPSLGWSEEDIGGMVEGFSRVLGLHFLPEDRAAVDAALVAGHTLVESGDSPLRRAVAGLADAVCPDSRAATRTRRGRRRRALGRPRGARSA